MKVYSIFHLPKLGYNNNNNNNNNNNILLFILGQFQAKKPQYIKNLLKLIVNNGLYYQI